MKWTEEPSEQSARQPGHCDARYSARCASTEGARRPFFPLPRLTLPEPLCYSLAHMKTHSPLSTPA